VTVGQVRGLGPVKKSMRLPHYMLLVALLPAGAAQDAKFSSEVKVVALLATVHDSNGAIVKNLTRDDFRLEEDGHPQTIRYFSRESDLPLTIALLVDTSRSMLTVFAEECIAGSRFFEHVLREDIDSAAVLHFDRNIGVLQEFTSSREKLTSALTQLKIPAQGESDTRLYDAVRYASEALMQKRSGPKAFILLSDGMDVRSQTTSIATAIEYAQRADTMIYSILIGDRPIFPGRKRGRSGTRNAAQSSWRDSPGRLAAGSSKFPPATPSTRSTRKSKMICAASTASVIRQTGRTRTESIAS
jgi:VWFA-related protein